MSKRFYWMMISIILFTFLLAPNVYASKSEQIVTQANKHLGTPYRYGGTTPAGFDCSGFIRYVFAETGITLPRTSQEQFKVGKSIKKADLVVGDLVFFQTYAPGASHVGIHIGNNKFIHASSSRGISIASINDPYYWGPRYIGARRVLPEEQNTIEYMQQKIESLPKGQYLDVPANHWAHEAIASLSVDGIIHGTSAGYFQPDDVISKAQAAVLISNVLNLDPNTNPITLNDVPSNYWAKDGIHAAVTAGLFAIDNGNFHPNQPLTRSDIANLVSEAFNLTTQDSYPTFQDVPNNHFAYIGIAKVTSNGMMSGFDDNTYRPDENITRAQFAKVLHTALGK